MKQLRTQTTTWIKAAGIRMVRTMAQAALAMVGTATILAEVNWAYVLSAAAVAGLLSLLTSLAGLPEVEDYE